MLYQAEITLHCIIDLFKGYLPSFKKSFYKLHAILRDLYKLINCEDTAFGLPAGVQPELCKQEDWIYNRVLLTFSKVIFPASKSPFINFMRRNIRFRVLFRITIFFAVICAPVQPELCKQEDWIYNRGMPIGNLTSQMFANIYLNELDQFCKHDLHISSRNRSISASI